MSLHGTTVVYGATIVLLLDTIVCKANPSVCVYSRWFVLILRLWMWGLSLGKAHCFYVCKCPAATTVILAVAGLSQQRWRPAQALVTQALTGDTLVVLWCAYALTPPSVLLALPQTCYTNLLFLSPDQWYFSFYTYLWQLNLGNLFKKVSPLIRLYIYI